MKNHVCQLEGVLSFTLASLEAQIKTMHLLVQDDRRTEAAEYTKRLIASLLQVIDAVEHDVEDEIETDIENLLDHSATHLKFFDVLKKNLPEIQAIDILARNQNARHRSYTKALALLEHRTSTDAHRRLQGIKERAKSLLSFAEKV